MLLIGTVCLLSSPVRAADDPVQKAMKAYEKHRYEDAHRDLRAALPSLAPAKQPSAHLALGMIALKNAELHRAFARVSSEVTVDHLKRLAAERGAGRSRYSDLYLGLALLEGGNGAAASKPLEKFIARGGDPRQTAIARIALGEAANQRGNKQKAQEQWGGVGTSDLEVRIGIAAAGSRAGLTDRDPAPLCDGVLTEARRTGKQLSLAVVTDCLGVYGRSGSIDKGFDLLARADLRSYSYRESIGKSKVISFYDPQLLSNLAVFYLQAGIASLEKAAADPQLKGVASYYLGEAYLQAGNADQAAKALGAFLGSPQMPAQYRNRALVRQGEIRYRMGKQADAIGGWDELARNQPSDPDVLAEILFSCGRLRTDCPRVAQTAAAAAETGEGKRFAIGNIGLGRYYLAKKDTAKAVAYLEAGRDKGNKNKIESNDPLMLVDLSDAYYRTRKFSEALEIYFEMSKQFPQVRQIQEALQGIYSMEHKSAGDVKIY